MEKLILFGELFKTKRIALFKAKAQQKKANKKKQNKLSGRLQAKLRRAKGRAKRKTHISIIELYNNFQKKKIKERERKVNKRLKK